MEIKKKLAEKWQEATKAVLPIICIVLALCFSIAPTLPSILLCFLLGFLITISEPDLQVLAGQVPAVPNMVLILAVAAGVGCFWCWPCCVC